jgi:hypothetical protein
MSVSTQLAVATLGVFASAGIWLATQSRVRDTTHTHTHRGYPPVQVVSGVDGESYRVLPTRYQQAAADLLARVRAALWEICVECKRLAATESGRALGEEPLRWIAALDRRVRSPQDLVLLEQNGAKGVAFNVDKGVGGIHLCLRGEEGGLASFEVVLYVAIHELTHMAIDTYAPTEGGISSHSPEFKRAEAFLMDIGKRLELVRPQRIPGKTLCGIRIPRPEDAR